MNSSRILKIVFKKLIMYGALLSVVLVASACTKAKDQQKNPTDPDPIVHQAHLPSGWYVQDKSTLTRELNQYFDIARKEFPMAGDPVSVCALIVPHAGHFYSGLCAATAYQTLLPADSKGKNKHIKRVIILSPSHTHVVQGIVFPEYTVYRTALGDIPVDTQSITRLRKGASVFRLYAEPHNREHAIEVQLPFLQHVLEDFSIIPLIVGNIATIEDFKEASKQFEKIVDEQTLVVVSSDFVHHGPNYDYNLFDKDISRQVCHLDTLAVKAITSGYFDIFHKMIKETNATICGREVIKLLLGMIQDGVFGQVYPRLSCYYTSAHLVQARNQQGKIDCKKLLATVPDAQAKNSVSYVGLVFTQQAPHEFDKPDRLTGYEKKALLSLARQTLENSFATGEQQVKEHLLYPIVSPGVEQQVGAFVTLNTKKGDLRGCIGRMQAAQPLFKTIVEMSKSAAFHDTRFAPVTKQELDSLVIDITVLSKPEPIDSCKDIKIGKHGVVLNKFNEKGNRIGSSVFLPQVPVSYRWDVEKTLQQLSLKAGFGRDAWKENCRFEVFEGFEIKED